MPIYRIHYRPETGQASEIYEADSVDVEGDVHVVLRRTVFVINKPRDVVVRRIAAAAVAEVVEVVPELPVEQQGGHR